MISLSVKSSDPWQPVVPKRAKPHNHQENAKKRKEAPWENDKEEEIKSAKRHKRAESDESADDSSREEEDGLVFLEAAPGSGSQHNRLATEPAATKGLKSRQNKTAAETEEPAGGELEGQESHENDESDESGYSDTFYGRVPVENESEDEGEEAPKDDEAEADQDEHSSAELSYSPGDEIDDAKSPEEGVKERKEDTTVAGRAKVQSPGLVSRQMFAPIDTVKVMVSVAPVVVPEAAPQARPVPASSLAKDATTIFSAVAIAGTAAAIVMSMVNAHN